MDDWTDGYVADVGYTFGYYTELNPLRVRLAFLSAGFAFPEFGAACELGFGQGLSINVHAAASGTEWHGTDFNPTQVGFARELAGAAGTKVNLYDEAFAEFAQRKDLPDFDYIGLHGIWSWISDENREVIVDFIRRKLKVRGVLYISYNSLPGWANFAPIRHLMAEHADIIGVEGHGILTRVGGAIEFIDGFMGTDPTFARANPQVPERFKRIKDQNRHYLVHEYFNGHWDPTYFATMVKSLAPAKVNFACSAHYLDHYDAVNLTADQRQFLQTIPDAHFRQSVRDFMINQQFRRDFWAKGARRLTMLEKMEALRAERVVLIAHREAVALKISSSLGEATLHSAIYDPILDYLADHRVRTIGQIEEAIRDKNISLSQLIEAVMVLVGAGYLSPAHDQATISRASKQTEKLNTALIDRARSSGDVNYLASPVTGGGITVGRFPQIYLLALRSGRKTPQEWAEYAWQLLQSQNQKIIKDGNTLESAEDNLAELTSQATSFAERYLPVLKALQIH